MEFGIMTEASMISGMDSLGTQPSAQAIQARYQEVIEEALLGDELGYTVFGTSEQHFLAPLCSVSAGELILATVAALTKRIKVRTAITLLPFHQPVRVAEQIATLDVLSNGRVEFGSGKGNSKLTAGGFNIDIAETEERWQEGMDIVIRAWTQDEFSYQGKYYQVPPRRLSPKMIQKPHPKLWYAAISPASHERAGQKGLGVMSLTVGVNLRQLEKRVKTYRAAIKQAEPYAGIVNDRFSVYCLAHCADTNEQARNEARAPMLAYLKGVVDLYEETLKASGSALDFGETRKTISDFDLLDRTDNVLVGDPQTVIEKIKRYESLGVEEIFFRMEGLPHDKVMKSIRLIGEHIIPHFKKH